MTAEPLPDPASEHHAHRVRLWLGTYPVDGTDGRPDGGEGIWRLTLDPATGGLTGEQAVTCAAPSFVAVSADGRTLYAAHETGEGTVSCYAVDDDGDLDLRGRVATGGAAPCHLLLDPAGRALWVTNYSSGSVTVVRLAPDGTFAAAGASAGDPPAADQVLGHDRPGAGTVAHRQEAPHAHSSHLAPGGTHLLVADLGTDELRRYRIRDDGTLEPDGVAVTFAPGTGPRHLADGPDGHLYVLGELSRTVHVLAWDAATGTATPVATVPVGRTPTTPGTPLLPAHVVSVAEEVLVGVRGADVLARYTVHDGGARLQHVGDTPVGGASPRHFAVVPAAAGGAWVVDAVQDAGLVTVLRHDGTGVAGDVVDAFPLPYVACVVPA